ncbi:MAG: asparagine synthase-related protein, partial [Solirubrobacteraceae bacterium]
GLTVGPGALLARGPGRAQRLATALQARDPVSRLLASAGLVQPELRAGLFSGALAEHADAARAVVSGHHRRIPSAAPLEAALYLDARLGLVDDMLTYFDRASMACSLEVRVPFLDHKFVELCARIPAGAKVRRLQGKHVLRLAAKELVPEFVLHKRKRGFFNEAVGPWLRASGGATVTDVLQSGEPAYTRIIDRAVVDQAIGGWRAGDSRHAPLLLSLIMLELWLDGYLDRAFAEVDDRAQVA